MANPSYFAGSHGFVIESGGNFATVQGNQILNYFNREPERKTALTMYDQVLQGDIHRTEDFGVHEYRRRWYDREPRFKKTICAAEVIGLEGRVFTVMSYTGPEAHEAFEKDFQKYSRTLNAGPFQVYGINTNVPTVLFYDERQPVAKFLDGVGYWGRKYVRALINKLNWRQNEIWLDPKKGELCQGPAGPECGYIYGNTVPWGNLPCSAELLQEGNCLAYLASLKARRVDRRVVGVISEHDILDRSEVKVHQPTILSASTNATVAVSGGLWKEVWSCGEREVMENGVTRFTLKDEGGEIELWIDKEEECAVWMSQALSIFHARGISLDDDLRQFKLMIPYLKLDGYLWTSESTRQRRRGKSIYLFLHPFSPSTPTKSCKTSSLHHWSFDPTGRHPLPAQICKDLGLPIKLSLIVWSTYRYCWNNEHYKQMHQYQLAGGFDPKTTDFARHLGFHIFQVQSDSDRFEDVDGTFTVVFHTYLVLIYSGAISPAQSPPAISTSSSLGDLGENSYQPNTQLPPLQHAVSTPFNDSLPHPGASASPPSTASHTSSTDSTYPNDLIDSGAVTTASLMAIQSPSAVSTSGQDDRGSGYFRPNTQYFPSQAQHAVSTPFSNQTPYPGTSTASIASYSHTSADFDPSFVGFSGSTYPNNSTGRNANLQSSSLCHAQFPPLPVPQATYSLPSPAYPSTSQELRGDTLSLKHGRDDFDLEGIAGGSGKRLRLVGPGKSDSTSGLWPPQDAECGGSSGRLESAGVGDVVRGKQPHMPNEMGGYVVGTNELKDENRRLREKIERLKEMEENRRLKEELERMEETLGVGTLSLGSYRAV